MRAKLVPFDGGDAIEILKDLTLVGRKDDCDLRLDHKSVSKLHCVLVKTDGLLLLRDLGSTNGTRVNGQRVRRAALLPDDKLTIAGFTYRVHLGPSEPPQPDPDEHTQQINSEDVQRVLKNGSNQPMDQSDDFDLPPVQHNLPDVYSDDNS